MSNCIRRGTPIRITAGVLEGKHGYVQEFKHDAVYDNGPAAAPTTYNISYRILVFYGGFSIEGIAGVVDVWVADDFVEIAVT